MRDIDEVQEAWLRAWRFAARAHAAQTMRDQTFPYIVHLGGVAMEVLAAHQLAPFADPGLAVQCALLHDTLEDTATEEGEILERFGPRVAAGVRALTKDASLPTAEQMADSLRLIHEQPREVWAVKLADRITNLQTPPARWTFERVTRYRAEAERILAALGEGNAPLAARLARKIAAYPPTQE